MGTNTVESDAAIRHSHDSPPSFIIMVFPAIMSPYLWAPVTHKDWEMGPSKSKWLNLSGVSDCTMGINSCPSSSFCILFWHLLNEGSNNCNLYEALLPDGLQFSYLATGIFSLSSCAGLSFFLILFPVALCYPFPCLDHKKVKVQNFHLLSGCSSASGSIQRKVPAQLGVSHWCTELSPCG